VETEKQPWIAEFYEKEKTSADSDEVCRETEEVSGFLCRSFEAYVESLNKEYGQHAISVLSLPPVFMHVVFDTEPKTPGFLIFFGTSKLIMALCGRENAVTFVGREIDSGSQKPKKNLKLLGVTWEERKNGGYLFRDSTGVEIKIRELMLRITRWGAS